MDNFILVHNYDDDTDSIMSNDKLSTLQYMFSENYSYRPLSVEEYNILIGMELKWICKLA